MNGNIEFSLQRVPKALSVKSYYRAVVQSKGIFGNEELAERLAENTKEASVHWRYFIDALSPNLPGFPKHIRIRASV